MSCLPAPLHRSWNCKASDRLGPMLCRAQPMQHLLQVEIPRLQLFQAGIVGWQLYSSRILKMALSPWLHQELPQWGLSAVFCSYDKSVRAASLSMTSFEIQVEKVMSHQLLELMCLQSQHHIDCQGLWLVPSGVWVESNSGPV